MMFCAPLFADGEWIKFVIPLVMFLVWVANQFFGGETPAARQRKAMQRARPNPPPQPPTEKQRIEDEVGEFLRRAAGQRPAKEVAPVAPPNSAARAPKMVRKPLPMLEAVSDDDAPTAARAASADKLRTMVSSLPTEISQRPLEEIQSQGRDIEQTLTAMQSHLSQTFSHHVGNLSEPSVAAEVVEAPASAASEMAAMLRDPQSIRQAIVISEILRRPEERW